MDIKVQEVVNDQNLCGEGPLWDWRNNRLIWTDLSASLVFELEPITGRQDIISRGLMVAAIALHQGGCLIVAGSTGLHLWRGQDEYETVVQSHEGRTLNINDMTVGACGRVYFGTVYWNTDGMVDYGKIYRIDSDRSVHVLDDGFSHTNGMGFSLDQRTMYVTDSAERIIYAYDFDPMTGTAHNKRVFVRVPRTEGLPDGLTVDADGFVWSAQWYGSQIVRYTPDGHVERRIPIPASQVTSMAFGGVDLCELYVTTAADVWTSELIPTGYDSTAMIAGGALYRVVPDVCGNREHLANL